jgi:hypothetical protein
MGESHGCLFEPSFNRTVKVVATDDRITSDSGLLLLREADHRLGITESLAERLHDPRRDDRIRYQLVELLRERIYAFAVGYAAQDDADRMAHDPAMKLAAWNRPGEQPLDERMASQPTQSRLIDILAHHKAGSCLDLVRFQRDVLKAGGRVVKHARRLVLYVAQAAAPFWKRLVECINRWKLPARFPKPQGSRPRDWMPSPLHAFQFEVRRE